MGMAPYLRPRGEPYPHPQKDMPISGVCRYPGNPNGIPSHFEGVQPNSKPPPRENPSRRLEEYSDLESAIAFVYGLRMAAPTPFSTSRAAERSQSYAKSHLNSYLKSSLEGAKAEMRAEILNGGLDREELKRDLQNQINAIARYLQPSEIDKIIRLNVLASVLEDISSDRIWKRDYL